MNYDDERMLLARTLQAEAGNQGLNGMIAAGSVIKNRANRSKKPLRDVIMADGQFSAWNGVTGYAGGEQGQDMTFDPNSEALSAADAILSGEAPDPTGGATHYYNPSISDPVWGERSGSNWTRVGDHLFGNAGGFNSTPSKRPSGLSYGNSVSGPSPMSGSERQAALGVEARAGVPQAALGDDQAAGLQESTWKDDIEDRIENSRFGKWKSGMDGKIANFTGKEPDKDAQAKRDRLSNSQTLIQNGLALMNRGFV